MCRALEVSARVTLGDGVRLEIERAHIPRWYRRADGPSMRRVSAIGSNRDSENEACLVTASCDVVDGLVDPTIRYAVVD